MKNLVTISLPRQNIERAATIVVERDSPYKIVENLRGSWKKFLKKERSYFSDHKIAQIVPLHNATGVRDKRQIEKMFRDVQKGYHILGTDHFPNIKLIVDPKKRLLLFDGHHSLISYFRHGRKYLREVPFVVISSEEYEPLKADAVAAFFDPKDRDAILQDWEKYVVNWQARGEDKLEVRQVNSIEELVNQLGERDKSAVEK